MMMAPASVRFFRKCGIVRRNQRFERKRAASGPQIAGLYVVLERDGDACSGPAHTTGCVAIRSSAS